MESKLPPSFKASKLSREDVRARLRIADHPKASMAGDEPIGAQFVLNVMELLPYDKNPRQADCHFSAPDRSVPDEARAGDRDCRLSKHVRVRPGSAN